MGKNSPFYNNGGGSPLDSVSSLLCPVNFLEGGHDVCMKPVLKMPAGHCLTLLELRLVSGRKHGCKLQHT